MCWLAATRSRFRSRQLQAMGTGRTNGD
jgi:hypothetical protein